MRIRAMMFAVAVCAAVCSAWGRSFTLDLRSRNVAEGERRLASSGNVCPDGALRSFDLDAGVADVGDVAVGDELKFTLFDDVTLTLVLKEKMPTALGGDAFIAEANGYEGVKNAVVLRTAYGLVVDVQDFLRRRVYKVISTAAGVKVQELEALGGGKCGSDSLTPPAAEGARPARSAQSVPRLASDPARQGGVYVDVLVAFDANALIWVDSRGGMTNFAQVAVQKMNVALSNVGLDSSFRFRLVGVIGVAVSSDDFGYVLDSAVYGSAGWRTIRAMRNAVGADVVSVMIDTGSAYGTTGLGYSLRRGDLHDFSEYAYSVCSIRAVAQSHTMTHEIGHNMGCGHSDLQLADPGPQLYDYSSGYYFQTYNHGYYDSYHTIMAYDYAGPWGDEVEVPYFSSPNYTYGGVPVGDEVHDNVQTLYRTFTTAAGWRAESAEGVSGIGSAPVLVVVDPDCESMGRASGGDNVFKAGAKVTIRATANSGYAFAGWYLDGEPLSGDSDFRMATYPYVATGEPVIIKARFVTAAEDAMSLTMNLDDMTAAADGTFSICLLECVESLSMPKFAVSGLPAGLKYDAGTMTIGGKATKPGVYTVKVTATNASATGGNAVVREFALTVPNITSEKLPNLIPDVDAYGTIQCGVAFNPGLVDCAPEEGWTVKVAGLPTGLKWDAKAGVITGVPTKAGTYTVTFTASKKGEANQIATITLVAEALPEWAQGTFAGYVKTFGGEPDYEDAYGSATMTVTANGKVSGKIALGGTNWTFSAASYAASDGGDCFEVAAEAKSGKATMPLWLMVQSGSLAETGLLNGSAGGWLGDSGPAEVSLWRNVWKDKSTAAAAKAEIAKWEGAYTISVEDGGYLSLTVGKSGDVKATGKLADGTAVSATAPLMYRDGWDFFTVFCTAPSAYKGGYLWLPVGFGAERGALDDLGLGMVASSRNPQATGEYGEGFTRHLGFTGACYDKTNMLSDDFEVLRFMALEPMLNGNSPTNECAAEVRFDAKGKPVIAKETGLTLSFAQATGVFKGGFTFVFDAKTKKKVNFEGIVVQGQNSFFGFYLWDATGSYADPKTGKPKTYKYKELHPMTLFAP